MLIMRAFNIVREHLNKHEIRYLMRKFRFPEEKITDLEATYHGKENLKDRVFHAMLYWREMAGVEASMDELIRVLHIVGMEALSQKLRALKVCSQALRI